MFGLVKKEADNSINFNNEPISQNRTFFGLLPGTGQRMANQQPKNCVTEPCQYGTEFGLLFKQAKDDKKKGSLMLFRDGHF